MKSWVLASRPRLGIYAYSFTCFIAYLLLTTVMYALNPIEQENLLPGTLAWQINASNQARGREIEGYASLTSVN